MANPIIFFSDYTSAPATGWNGSATKGAAITIWGLNLGTQGVQGSDTITCCGQVLGASSVVEWAVSDAYNARSLQRTTFFLNSSMLAAGPSDNVGTISVTIGGVSATAPIPFTAKASGHIYFLDPVNGLDTYDGLRDTVTGGHGPWQHIYAACPDGTNPASLNITRAGDVVYLRAGNYNVASTYSNDSGNLWTIRNFPGTAGSPFCLGSYPGEFPIIGSGGSLASGFHLASSYGSTGPIGYIQHGRIIFETTTSAYDGGMGHDLRAVGWLIRNSTTYTASGIFSFSSSWNCNIYGVKFLNSGYDNWKHAIYPSCSFSSLPHDSTNHDIGWCEVDNWISNQQLTLGTYRYGSAAFNFRNGSTTYFVKNVYIHNCFFHDSPDAGVLACENDSGAGMTGIYFYNNLMVNIGTGNGDGHLWATSSLTAYHYNNTWYNCGSPTGSSGITYLFYQVGGSGSVAYTYSINNIFYMTNSGDDYISRGNQYVLWTSDHDVYYGAAIQFSSYGESTPYTVINNYFTANPLFVNPVLSPDASGTWDFTLQATSPYIAAGNYTDPTLLLTVTTDYNGIARPSNSAYDIGAYQYTAGVRTLFTIAGNITYNGAGFPSVSVALSGSGSGVALTDGSGNYTFSSQPNGTYTITPSLTNYTFTPSALGGVVVNGADVSGQNFIATLTQTPQYPGSRLGFNSNLIVQMSRGFK